MALAIKADKLSKAYQLGEFSTGTISRDIERWWYKMRKKEDPFLRIGETNDRTVKGTSDIVWSLKDISFEIKQGEAVGVIGRNGAGKSTLLKVLSRVTTPTSGNVKVKGRIASLLEVGTGFHPELTGKENIYLNGAILGMRKREIRRKFDEIVDFAGVERYIDTPVKRYSSGMYVRLAFAVAAHLESEILIVDEVLAVGDMEFQKKCLGKMDEVSKGEGRTVLFVSHNMASIKTLCNTGILLSNGQIKTKGAIDDVTDEYRKVTLSDLGHSREWDNIGDAPGNDIVRITRVQAVDRFGNTIQEADVTEEFFLEMYYTVLEEGHVLWHSFNFHNDLAINIFDTHSTTGPFYTTPHPKGDFVSRVRVPGNLLNVGNLIIGCAIFNHKKQAIHTWLKEIIRMQIIEGYKTQVTARGETSGHWPGVVRPLLEWDTSKL